MRAHLKLLVISLLVCTPVCFAQDHAKSVSPAPAKAASSKQAFITNNASTVANFQADGTATIENAEQIHVLSEAGVQQLGLLVFNYTSANERLKIDYVRVRKPDGTVIETPLDAVQDMPAQITRLAPMYSDYREKHVPVKGLAVGDVLEYQTETQLVHPLIPNEFWYSYNFTKNVVIQQEELQVSFPKSLYVQIKSPDLKPVITEQGSLTVYSWKSSNSEVNTTSQPADAAPSFPTVEITTFRNWQEVGRWWATLESQAVKPTPDIRAKAAELTKGMTTDDEKLRAIYHYVSTEFRYISVSFGIGRYKPHTASEVLSNMYGDCKDKHVLLASLLQAVGLGAYPALINATAKIDPDVPSPSQFDHVISVIPEGKDLVWLDTTAEVAPFGFLLSNLRGKKTLLMPRGKEPYLAKTPADPPFKMFQRFYANGKLSDDGTFTGKMRQIARGDYGVVLRILFFLTPQSQWQNLVQRISTLSGFGGEVSNVTASDPSDTDKPFEYSYDYIRKDFGDWSAGKTVPATMPIFLPAWTITGKQPLTPLKLGSPNDIMLKSSIELPKGYTTVSFPTSLSREDFADYTSSCYSREGVFYTSRRLTIKEREIPVAERAMYEYFRTTVNGDQDRTITVAKDAAAANNPDVSVEALGLMDQAYDASQDGNLKDALADAQKTIKLTPKWSEGWDELAFADLGLGRNQEALSALHTAIQLAPKSPRAYVILGMHLEKSTHYGQARQVWRNLLKQDPGNWIAGIHLGALLLQERRYNEAFAVLEPAAKQSGELADPRYDAMLGVVALRAGKTQEGISALETAVKLNPIPFILNNAAYYLADANVDMAEAQSYAEKAIKADEATAAQISLDTLQDKDLGAMVMLAHEWDTLGWVYFREDKLQDAEKYLKAAWNLEQAPAAADHLGQLYEKLGRKQAAIHMYALSAADPDAPRGASDANLVRLVPVNAKRDALIDRAAAELSQMRTVELGKMRGRTGTAEFWVLFLPGAKVEGVTFASGSEQLRSAAQSIAHAHFQAPLPDDSLTRIIRRGVLVCEGMGLNCDFTLLPVDSLRSVQ